MNTNFSINTNIRRNKNAFYAVSLIAIFAASITMAFAPSISAQIGITQPRKTYSYISVAPNLVGVGQDLTVNLWVCPFPQNYSTAPCNQGFSGLSVTFTRPDGTKDTFMPTQGSGTYVAGQTDPLGTIYFYYEPNKAGNWSVTSSFPAQNITDFSGTVQYAASTSEPYYFTVTTEQQNAGLLNGYPWAPLPNDNVFWTYPISPNNREWNSVASNWLNLYSNNWNPYGSAPSTGHILWKTQVGLGGLVGGDRNSISYQPTMSYSYPILSGKVYLPFSTLGSFKCLDLTTGELVFNTTGSISAAINLPGNTYYQATGTYGPTGVLEAASYGSTPTPMLFGSSGTSWNYYEPLSGKLSRTITNVTASGYTMTDNSPLVWGYTTSGFNLTSYAYNSFYIWEWNITKVVNNDWQTGLVWKSANINNPAKGQFAPGDGSARTNYFVSWDRKYMVIGGGPGTTGAMGFDASNGKSIWNISFGFTAENSKINLQGTNNFFVYNTDTATIHCYSAATGAELWKNTFGIYPWNTKASMLSPVNDDKNLYLLDPSGEICALSLTDGHVVWQSTVEKSTEEASNSKGRWYGLVVAGGIVYNYAGYSPLVYELNPIPRFSFLDAINATTGETVFKLNGGLYPVAAANGYLMAVSFFNGYEYCLGKGQTSTTTSIRNNVIAKGANVLIEGNVLDKSPASPNTPAVSDASMSEWMDYLHMQNVTLLNNPPKEQGVPVTLTAIDPNMNPITIGTTTTNGAGSYSFLWTPQIEGLYTITASFDGTNSYWPSSAETHLAVNAAVATTAPTAALTQSAADLYLLPGIISIIVAIAIVGAILVLLVVKKRP
jgi:hypothetical protein